MSCRSAVISTLLAALVCVLVSACARSGGHTLPADPEPTGGTSDYSDPKAPKAIPPPSSPPSPAAFLCCPSI